VAALPKSNAPAAAARSTPEAPRPARAATRERATPTAAPAAAAAPTTATLRIETDVPGASVFMDRVGVGTTPLTIPNLALGAHWLDVRAPGYEGFANSIDVEPGQRTLTVPLKPVALDVRVDVVHKHGMGSCKGRLLASPNGVRYEAADGKDSFSVTLADIATLDVAINNLRLKTRQGRTFNFADTAADAAGLFRFHQVVEEARRTGRP
jgi:hypothetical protein